MVTHAEKLNEILRRSDTLGEAIRLETRNNKIKWEDLVYLLKSGDYPIKEDNGDSLILSIDGEPYAEIEVSYSHTALNFISIHLLNYRFIDPDLEVKYVREPVTLYNNLVDAIGYINNIYRDIREWQ